MSKRITPDSTGSLVASANYYGERKGPSYRERAEAAEKKCADLARRVQEMQEDSALLDGLEALLDQGAHRSVWHMIFDLATTADPSDDSYLPLREAIRQALERVKS